jgi:hypothetical protein
MSAGNLISKMIRTSAHGIGRLIPSSSLFASGDNKWGCLRVVALTPSDFLGRPQRGSLYNKQAPDKSGIPLRKCSLRVNNGKPVNHIKINQMKFKNKTHQSYSPASEVPTALYKGAVAEVVVNEVKLTRVGVVRVGIFAGNLDAWGKVPLRIHGSPAATIGVHLALTIQSPAPEIIVIIPMLTYRDFLNAPATQTLVSNMLELIHSDHGVRIKEGVELAIKIRESRPGSEAAGRFGRLQ